jgi:fatty acid desaturase
MEPLPVSHYARALRGDLPGELFRPEPRRLAWLAVHAALASAGLVAIGAGVAWPVALAVALVVGHSFAGMAFVAHETLHGSVVRGSRLRKLIGGLGFAPLCISPTLWIAWHNKVHHGHTGQIGVDPDVYTTLDAYRADATLRLMNRILPGWRHWAGGLTLLFGLSGQTLKLFLRARTGPPGERRAIRLETGAAVLAWAAIGWAVGPLGILFAFVIPIGVANVILTAYILTNHALSPLTDVNDPLLNSLSVTAPRVVEVLHLNFGYHVEHHVFPAMSPRHAPRVRAALRTRWPERYQSLPVGRALVRIFSTSRVYKDAVTMIDPASGREFPALVPRP